jgi:hypothetical protein
LVSCSAFVASFLVLSPPPLVFGSDFVAPILVLNSVSFVYGTHCWHPFLCFWFLLLQRCGWPLFYLADPPSVVDAALGIALDLHLVFFSPWND